MVTYNDILNLIKDCSSAKFCTPDTTLESLSIDTISAIGQLLAAGEILVAADYSLLPDGKTFRSVKQIVLSKPVCEIITLRDILSEIKILESVHEYPTPDDKLHYVTEGWYLESSDFENVGVNAKRLRTLITHLYDIEIEKKAITRQYGTVKEFCESLTERINRAIQFQKRK